MLGKRLGFTLGSELKTTLGSPLGNVEGCELGFGEVWLDGTSEGINESVGADVVGVLSTE